jgi:hypothetical protein
MTSNPETRHMDIQAEAQRMMQDDLYAWELIRRFKLHFADGNLPKAEQLQEAEQLRLVFCEYVSLWRPQGREIESSDDYNLNMTANDCCEPFLYPDDPPAPPRP